MRYIFIVCCFIRFSVFSQDSTSLASIVNEMLQKDFGIQLLKNNAKIASNNNNAGAAGYLPTLDVNATQSWGTSNLRQEYFSGASKSASGAKSNSLSASAMLNWTFFDGFKMFATDKKLDLLEEQANLNLTAEMEMKIYQAGVLYYSLLQQEKLNQIYLEAISLSQARFDLMTLKNQSGAANELEVVQARLDLNADSSIYLENLKNIQNLKESINLFLARDANTPIQVDAWMENRMDISWESVENAAKSQNTSLLLAKSNIAVREKERKEAQSFFYPQLSVYGQYSLARSESQAGFMLSNMTYGPSVGITLKWNILDNLSKFTNLKNNKIQLENAEIQENQTKFTLNSQLRQAFNEYEWAKQNLQIQQRNIDAANMNFEIAKKSLQSGSITPLELRTVQFSIVQAKSRYILAQLTCKTAELNLSLLTGDFKQMLK